MMIQLLGQKTRNEILDIRKEKPAYADPMYRPPPKPTEISTEISPRKTSNLATDSLEQDIHIDFEENSPSRRCDI